MLDPKIHSLLQVYECGSFMAAARKLSITQPAVSHHIKALEEELGITIFDRRGGKVILTREGEEVIQCARKMLGLYRNLQQDLRDRKQRLSRLGQVYASADAIKQLSVIIAFELAYRDADRRLRHT